MAARGAPGEFVPDGDSGFDVFMTVRRGNGTFRVDAGPSNTGAAIVRGVGVPDPSAYSGHAFELRFTGPSTFDVVDLDSGTAVLAAQPYLSGGSISFAGVEVTIEGKPAGGDVFQLQPSGQSPVFGIVSDLVEALQDPVVDTVSQSRLHQSLGNAIEDLDQTLDHWRTVRSRIGARLQSLDQHADTNELLNVRAQDTLSQLKDLDYAEAVAQFTQILVGLEAAQKTFAQVQGLSLFDRLP